MYENYPQLKDKKGSQISIDDFKNILENQSIFEISKTHFSGGYLSEKNVKSMKQQELIDWDDEINRSSEYTKF